MSLPAHLSELLRHRLLHPYPQQQHVFDARQDHQGHQDTQVLIASSLQYYTAILVGVTGVCCSRAMFLVSVAIVVNRLVAYMSCSLYGVAWRVTRLR